MESTPAVTAICARIRVSAQTRFFFYAKAALGSVLIGVSLPCALVCLRCIHEPKGVPPLGLFLVATLFCAPGAGVLSMLLFAIIERKAQHQSLKQVMTAGSIGGSVMAFLNFPGYLAAVVLENDTFIFGRIILLFVVAGASCGLWISWQAWRTWHPEERFLPRFSLQTLMLLVFLWGALMLVFQPR